MSKYFAWTMPILIASISVSAFKPATHMHSAMLAVQDDFVFNDVVYRAPDHIKEALRNYAPYFRGGVVAPMDTEELAAPSSLDYLIEVGSTVKKNVEIVLSGHCFFIVRGSCEDNPRHRDKHAIPLGSV